MCVCVYTYIKVCTSHLLDRLHNTNTNALSVGPLQWAGVNPKPRVGQHVGV